jgi:hypothetical protein
LRLATCNYGRNIAPLFKIAAAKFQAAKFRTLPCSGCGNGPLPPLFITLHWWDVRRQPKTRAPLFLDKKSGRPHTRSYPLACRLRCLAAGLARCSAQPPPRRRARAPTLPGHSSAAPPPSPGPSRQARPPPRLGCAGLGHGAGACLGLFACLAQVLTQAVKQVLTQRRTGKLHASRWRQAS